MNELYIISGGHKEAWNLVFEKLNKREQDVLKNEFSKPYFENSAHFNISHSKGIAVVCFCEEPVGVDVEKIRDVNLKIKDRFFGDTEKEQVKTNSDFTKVWTAKESYIKYLGTGLSTPLNSFDVNNLDVNFLHFDYNDYHICVCTKNVIKFKIQGTK